MSLPLSLSRVHPRALGQEGQQMCCPGASRVSIRERSGRKASMSLPWSLSRVHPRALLAGGLGQ